MRWLAVAACLLAASCGHYERFALPSPGAPEQGGYAWSARETPVLGRGLGGKTDAVDALNPSVVPSPDGLVNLYSGFDGKRWRTLLARSGDGLHWQGGQLVIEPDGRTWEGAAIAANGAALARGGQIHYWYQAGDPPRIGLARGGDEAKWVKHPAPVLDYGPRGAWDERALGDPYVIGQAGWLYMYYLGEDRARRQRLGVARSRDGVLWTRHRGNPVLELGEDGAFDESGLGEPAVWRDRGWWWMLYTGRQRNEVRRMGLARSRDGLKWERTPLVIAGGQSWNAKVVCDATVIVEPDRVRVWFGGGDVAHPAENINGQIGYGELRWKPAAR
ncbi:MAG: hypothetical protein C0504_01505 [Candidatus Solibacter sp.]|nr:hypothetical protein [Candidatus Solibacter sp.]